MPGQFCIPECSGRDKLRIFELVVGFAIAHLFCCPGVDSELCRWLLDFHPSLFLGLFSGTSEPRLVKVIFSTLGVSIQSSTLISCTRSKTCYGSRRLETPLSPSATFHHDLVIPLRQTNTFKLNTIPPVSKKFIEAETENDPGSFSLHLRHRGQTARDV